MIRQQLLIERNRLQSELEGIDSELSGLPPGSIQISKCRAGWKWRVVLPSSDGSKHARIVIRKKDRELAEKLCQKKLLTQKKQFIERKIQYINALIEEFPFALEESIFPDHPEFQSLISSYQAKKSSTLAIWEQESYECSTDYPESLIIPTKALIKVRSKSEAMIANALTDAGLPFHYEQAHMFCDMKMYPDFTILHPQSGKIIIWEHFGLMDSENYALNATRKLNVYFNAGYVPGANLITTYESKNYPLDISYIEHLIYYHFS